MKKAVVILPTYNEAGNIKNLIENIIESTKNLGKWTVEILVVDSNSPDKTGSIVKKTTARYKQVYLLETKKEGLGKAYYQGFCYAIQNLKPFVIFEMDADFSHDPLDITRFLEQIEKGADFVIGSRYIKGGSIPENWGFHRKIFSVLGNTIVRFGFMKLKIHDWTNGFRAIKSWVINNNLDKIKNYSGYVFQIALLDNSIKDGAKITEVPIHFTDRKYGKSKISFSQYIFQIIVYILFNSSFVRFVVVGLIGFAIDFSVAYSLIVFASFSKPSANAISAEIAIMCNFLLNNFWSFRHKKIVGGVFIYIKNFFIFNFVSSGSIFIQWLGQIICLRIFGDKLVPLFGNIAIPSWIIYKVLIIAFIIIPYSYVLYNKVIWKEK